ncbi:predicted protein [Mycobacterium tuberculosis T85]|nr:predicted protein [Mycobacterium tuberculosis T85]
MEAANALRQFGLQTHVVEMMPRLMAQQIDEAGGALLARMIADLGIAVHVGTGTESIESVKHSDGSVWARVRLSDGEVIDAGVVIFAAGIRPRDELARAAGLAIGDRGGVLTDLSCRTSDPDIYAVGESRRDRRAVLRPGRARIHQRRGGGRPTAGRVGPSSPKRTCRPNSSCWVSTSPASATRWGQPRTASRLSSMTR